MSADYVPALGHRVLTPFYDLAIALATRERRWRKALVEQVAPTASDVILDVGCGTGSLIAQLGRHAPDALYIGLDPDLDILARARRKLNRAGLRVVFEEGFARDAGRFADRVVTKVVSSLVFHQVPLAEKAAGLAACFAALRSGGTLHIADYGLQRTSAMRRNFRRMQRFDGFENTEPNALGVLPRLIAEAGFGDVQEMLVLPTPTGSISIYRGVRL